jgi:DNA-binding transcriptional ArsR family regulator
LGHQIEGPIAMSAASHPTYRIRQNLPTRIGHVLLRPLGLLVRRVIWRLISLNAGAVSFWIAESPLVFGAMATLAKLRVFDRLRDGPQTAGELAQAVQADEDSLRRLLRSVSALGLLKRRRDDRYALNAVARQFCSDGALPLGAWAELWLNGLHVVQQMPEAVRTGRTPLQCVTDKTCWDYMDETLGSGELHDHAMNAFSAQVVDKIAASYDFSQAKTLVDVGGGRGALLAAFLRAAPHLRGTVCDLPQTRAAALETFAKQGVAERAEHVPGSFFESVPSGADLYSIKHALHDWDDAHAGRILQTIRTAIPAHGRLLIIEGAVDHDLLPGASVRAACDLSQWVSTWGKSRTLDELQALLESAGFRLENVHITPTLDALILEAKPVAVESPAAAAPHLSHPLLRKAA